MIQSRSSIALAAAVAVALIGTTARLWFGVDFADEGQHVSSTLLTLVGGRPFVNELYIQQLASQLATPLAWIYVQATGGTVGIVLALRLAAWLTALGVASYAYDRLRPYIFGPILRAGVALWPVLVWQSSVFSLYYNNITHIAWYLLAVAWLTTARETPARALDLFALGLAAVVVGAAYWPLVPVVGAAGALWLWRTRGCHAKRAALWLGLACGAVWVGSQLVGVAPADLEAGLRFSSWSSDTRGLGPKVLDHLRMLWAAPPRPWSLVVLAASAWAASAWRLRRWTAAHSWWALLALAVATAAQRISRFPIGDGWLTTAGLSALGLWALSIRLPVEGLQRRVPGPVVDAPAPTNGGADLPSAQICRDQQLFFDLSILSAFAALMMSALSSNGAAVFPVLGSYLIWLALIPLSSRLSPATAHLGTVLWLALACATTWTTVYGDGKLFELQETIDGTPFAGLRTSPLHARVIRDVDADLRALPPGQSVLFLDGFAAGYAWGAARPASRSLFLHPPHFRSQPRDLYVQAYQNANSLPDVIFDLNFFVYGSGRRHTVDPAAADPLRQALLAKGSYTVVHQRSDYTLWRRRETH